MSSLMGSHGMALATATAMAVSGTMILMALYRPQHLSVVDNQCDLRPCITSEFYDHFNNGNGICASDDGQVVAEEEMMTGVNETKTVRNAGLDRAGHMAREMPANRAALYSGILQARMQRMACY